MRYFRAVSGVVMLLFGAATMEAAPYLPFAAVGHDGGLVSGHYSGTASTSGPNDINLVGTTPGYVNDASTPGGGASGDVTITALPQGVTTFVGLAIHVTDTAGASHSLSTLNDPALADLVFDLNHSGIGGDFVITTYAYNSAPPQYADVESILSAGETALGGQPFDLLLTGANTLQPVGDRMYWSVDFSTAVGNLDGITAIGVTDIGAVAAPEPTGLVMLGIFAGPALLARRRRHRPGL